MQLLKELLELRESYKNLFTTHEKEKYAESAFAQLQSSYEKVGGLHGSGFKNIQDFIQNIPFWKLKIINGDIIAATYYKDKEGRKRVAISSDGSIAGKKAVADIMISDLLQGRAYVEQSSTSLNFLVKQLGYKELKNWIIPYEKISSELKIEIRTVPMNDPEIEKHPELKNFFYERKIGNEWHTKLALGKIKQKIVL